MFLEELGAQGVETLDLSTSAAGRARAVDAWRSGSKAAEKGWAEAGVATRSENSSTRIPDEVRAANTARFAEGMVVHHDQYGTGRVTLVIGHGPARKIKVRFSRAGERTFLADKAKLAIVKK
jgi:hypothetical protein